MNFTPFPELRSERLLLRKLLPADGEALARLRSDARVNEYIKRQKSMSPEDARSFIGKADEWVSAGNSIIWAIALSGDPALIGTVCLWNFNADKTGAEIGYELDPELQGRGLMREAIGMTLEYAFGTLRLRSVEAYIKAGNERSVRLSERSGFARTGLHIDTDEDGSAEMLVYSIKNERNYE